MGDTYTTEFTPLEAITDRRVTHRRTVGELEIEVEVQGYDADEAVEIVRALTDQDPTP